MRSGNLEVWRALLYAAVPQNVFVFIPDKKPNEIVKVNLRRALDGKIPTKSRTKLRTFLVSLMSG